MEKELTDEDKQLIAMALAELTLRCPIFEDDADILANKLGVGPLKSAFKRYRERN